jgi:hypothetical protein
MRAAHQAPQIKKSGANGGRQQMPSKASIKLAMAKSQTAQSNST